MIFDGAAYRAIDPRWAFGALSGDGAAVNGGRFNARGVPALYLALDPVGAVNEASQGFAGRIPPLTLCEYEVHCADIVDLRTPEQQQEAGTTLEAMACAWKLDAAPPSQRLASRLTGDGAAGVLVPSFALGAAPHHHNLVLWRWGEALPHRIRVFDPTGRLPSNQLSWP